MIAIRHIRMAPVVWYSAAVYAAFALIFGGFLFINPFIIGTTDGTTGGLAENCLRFALMVGAVSLWGAMLGAIAVVVYNRLARWTGGIRIEIEIIDSDSREAVEAPQT